MGEEAHASLPPPQDTLAWVHLGSHILPSCLIQGECRRTPANSADSESDPGFRPHLGWAGGGVGLGMDYTNLVGA